MKPTHLDIFSGIGGFALAAEWAGFETIGFSEIDPYANAVLKKHWPHVHNYGDIRTIPDGHCNLLTGGFPCQPFSIAGRKQGTRDHRNLWPAMLDVIERWQPDWVLGENVVNIKNMVLSTCLDELEERGYQSKAFDISACAVGLSMLERHVWIVAARRGVKLERRCEERIPEVSDSFICEPGANGNESARFRFGWDLHRSRLLRSRKGFPNFVDRIRGIGNAIPPQVAFEILKSIRSLIP